ncbi:Tetracyclin repressor domain-containing protein [Cupriavidus taiwanensis]|uniref:Tetracyclin repressor domain-containing protein n=1 Tax=Cupriavidus taiwanensis TaxID=164546 RepID=A0A976B1N3_9BURK|nr:TetR/AcrR family transcriptional regulator C-terminal domain-containing protein [Cupriavidus taiwanensis]SOZ66358.1 Tetracyclin repressor domain-containing protein [Cupriavidus taiwanensis]SOZ67181.1 Tetracyclin repressor domain-containing protein [Cupriavidus taiwanensis]SOZ70713.1 Tetracyclin repressor domain-containing protein [Cupriavidus taiwanensis]SPA08865.1 Tetracyclin repressor domain-containing protein [Cupriavidus taiwanensis]SPA18271.1 Tetracyclin repressor domain-containing pro
MKAPKIRRDQVIQAALDLLDQEGLDGLTLRKLALALDIQAPSLYWHFSGKQALMDAMADALVMNVVLPQSPDQPWDSRLRQIAAALRQALLKHRDGARVFAGTYVVSDHVLRISESMLEAFALAGVDVSRASTYSFSVLYYILGFVMEEQALGPHSEFDVASRKTAFEELAKRSYPRNLAAREAIFSTDFDARFSTGLELIIAGVKQQASEAAPRLTAGRGGASSAKRRSARRG